MRYRYYVSHALLQKRPEGAGSVSRVPAAEMETKVVEAVRQHVASDGVPDAAMSDDQSLVERYVDRIVLKPDAIEILLGNPESPRKQGGGEACSN